MSSDTASTDFQRRPQDDEFAEFYAGYVDKVRGDRILDVLLEQIDQIQKILSSIPDEQAAQIHPPYIWTIKQVVGHLIDGEKVFGYRLHRFGSGDLQTLTGFEHNDYVDNMDYTNVSLADLTEELVSSRKSNLLFLKRISPTAWDNVGEANQVKVSVRALAYIMAGHINHHLAIIQQRVSE